MAQYEIIGPDDFAERLQLALNACNLSRSQLSASLGVHKSLVSRWLSGEVKPTSYNLARISEMLAKLKAGFNMTLWTAPLTEFEAALGLQSIAPSTAAQISREKTPANRFSSGWTFRWEIGAIGFMAALVLIVAGFLLWRGAVERDVAKFTPGEKQRAAISEAIPAHGHAHRAEAVRLTQAARALIRERNRLSVADAEHLLRQAVAIDPSYAPAWARLGYATWFPWWWAEQHEAGAKPRLRAEALAYIERALAIEPNSAESQSIMGMVLTDTNEGRLCLEKAVRLDPDDPELWFWLAEAYQANNDLPGALKALEKARAADPAWQRSGDAYVNLLFRLRGPAEAYRALDGIAKTTNDQNWALQTRADLEYAEGRLADSAALAAAALRAHPQNPFWARNRLVFIAALLGNAALQNHLLAQDPMLRANFNPSHRPGWAYERAQSSLDTWWDATLVGEQAAQLVSEGRSSLLVSLYDRRFKTPEAFVSHCPAFCNALSVAPALVIALRKAGRRADADAVLAAANGQLRKLQWAGDRFFNTGVNAARLAALAGNAAVAKNHLRDAVQHGWKGQDTGFPDPAMDPVFETLRSDAEFQAILKLFRSAQQHEAEKLARIDVSGI